MFEAIGLECIGLVHPIANISLNTIKKAINLLSRSSLEHYIVLKMKWERGGLRGEREGGKGERHRERERDWEEGGEEYNMQGSQF